MQNKKTKAEVAATVASRRAARAEEKSRKTKQRDAEDKSPKGEIDPAKTYTRGALKQFGLGNTWFREAQKHGLEVHPAGRMKFVTGAELIRFISSGKGASLTPPPKKHQ